MFRLGETPAITRSAATGAYFRLPVRLTFEPVGIPAVPMGTWQ